MDNGRSRNVPPGAGAEILFSRLAISSTTISATVPWDRRLLRLRLTVLLVESLAGFSYPTIMVRAAVSPGWTMVRAAPDRGNGCRRRALSGQLRGPEGTVPRTL